MTLKMQTIATATAVTTLLLGFPPASQAASRIETALTNIMTLHRPGQAGFATIWDGNKYVQCRWMPEKVVRCEAAGSLMQPSLARVLAPERIERVVALGWHLDPSFGNYLQTFPGALSAAQIAEQILQVLKDGYGADIANLEIQTDWIKDTPCPPRNGPSQNLAGMINDSPAMAATAVRGCAYKPRPDSGVSGLADTTPKLITIYEARVSGEIQRLRVNIDRNIFVVFETGGGYIQCAPESGPQAIYCEAQSADSWPVLARILTSENVARLHAAGYTDPGRAPNYWKIYPVNEFNDRAIADELLTILHDVYRYNGLPKLEFKTERGRD